MSIGAVIGRRFTGQFLRPQSYFERRFHQKQEDAWIAYKAGLNILLDWGRRSGKSEWLVETLVEDIESHGRDCMYVALTQVQAREILWSKLVDRIGGRRDWRGNETRLTWSHSSGAVLSLKGMDLGKDKLRGGGKRLIAPDEFAFVKDPSIIREVFVPQLADYNGQFLFTSTPKGKNHFWKMKQAALQRPLEYFTSHCTVFENPFVSEEGRQKLLAEYSGTDDPLYRQEILAEYIVLNGLAFALPQDSYMDTRWDEATMDFSYHWQGVDHGFSPDPTACIWIAYNRRQGYFQVYGEYKRPQLLIHQHADVIRNAERYRFQDRFSDIDPQLIAEYAAVGLKLTPAQKGDKESRILRLVNALRTGKLRISRNCTQLLDEMQTYEWHQDGNDHLIDALIYAFTNLLVPELAAVEEDFHPRPRSRGVPLAQEFDLEDGDPVSGLD